jgi:hypothetical protein
LRNFVNKIFYSRLLLYNQVMLTDNPGFSFVSATPLGVQLAKIYIKLGMRLPIGAKI